MTPKSLILDYMIKLRNLKIKKYILSVIPKSRTQKNLERLADDSYEMALSKLEKKVENSLQDEQDKLEDQMVILNDLIFS